MAHPELSVTNFMDNSIGQGGHLCRRIKGYNFHIYILYLKMAFVLRIHDPVKIFQSGKDIS